PAGRESEWCTSFCSSLTSHQGTVNASLRVHSATRKKWNVLSEHTEVVRRFSLTSIASERHAGQCRGDKVTGRGASNGSARRCAYVHCALASRQRVREGGAPARSGAVEYAQRP